MCQKTSNQTSSTTGAQDWTQVYQAVRWIQLIMALLSVLGSGSIIVRLTTQRLSRRPEMFPLLLLSVSDLLLASCWLLGAAMFSLEGGGPGGGCYQLKALEQVLYLASFFCTLNYVWNLFTGIRDKFHSYMQVSNRVSTAARTTAVLSCLVPVLLTAPVFIQGNLSRCQANLSEPYRCLLVHTGPLFLRGQQSGSCLLLSSYSCCVFLLSFLLTLLSVLVLAVRARRLYRRLVASHGYLGNQQRARLRVLDRRVLLFPLMFCLSWGPAVALAFLRVLRPAAGGGVLGGVLYVSQAFTSGSQGFLNCLVYGWTCVHLRRAGGAPPQDPGPPQDYRPPLKDPRTPQDQGPPPLGPRRPLLGAQQVRSYHTMRTFC